MKNLVSIFLIVAVVLVSILPFSNAWAYVSVKGYYKSNGTYVAPHVRSNPNGLKTDNYGYTPSQGVYNPTYGTRGAEWDTPTYITDPDYYEGQALYQSETTRTVTPTYTTIQTTVAVRSQLTEPQIQSILGLLRAFGADSSVVSNVELSLR